MPPRAQRLRAFFATAAALGVSIPVSAAAVEPTGTGWWWAGRASAMFPPLFSPVPPVPEGGLYVAGGPNGPSGVSAMRFQVDPDGVETPLSLTLTLTIAEAYGAVAVVACAVKGDWQPAENGGWDHRPEADCGAASAPGAVNQDQTKLTFSVSPLQDNGTVNLVLVPGVDPSTQNPATFTASFEPPGPDTLAVTDPNPSTGSFVESNDEVVPGTVPARLTSGEPSSPGRGVSPGAFPTSAAVAPIIRVDSADSGQRGAGTTLLRSPFAVDASFAYPVVLALPLLFLCAGSYFGWALTRPIAVEGRGRRGRS